MDAFPEPSAHRLPLAGPVWVRTADLEVACVASGGPGGQNVNKTATKVELRVALAALQGLPGDALARLRDLAASHLTDAGELVIVDQQTRSQSRNREAAVARLRQLVATALVRPKRRRRTRPSRGAIERRLTAKRITGEKKAGRGEF